MNKIIKVVVVGLVTVFAVCLSAGCDHYNKRSLVNSASAFDRRGSAERLEAAYAQWISQHEKNGGDQKVVITLGWSESYSKKFTRAHGRAVLDLIKGHAAIEVEGLDDQAISDVWLIDNQPGPGHSAAPDPTDNLIWVGTLNKSGNRGTLSVDLGDVFDDFEVDLVAVTDSGKDPTMDGVLFGAVGLFQRLYTRTRTGRMIVPDDSSSYPLELLGPSLAYAQRPGLPFRSLIKRGADLFFNETFDGNGRTCGTCHPAENNFTIDPEFIATLPNDDPLFVAEFVPALQRNFEKPELMRRLGLILENTNGFGDLENDFTMRGVPHTLALPTSLTPAAGGADQVPVPPNQRTGWSGDGAPNDGTLRDFATGAVTQHFPRTLNRQPGVDFRLPTDEELDAMEAFQLSLGRQNEIDLAAMTFRSPVVEQGKVLFNTTDSRDGAAGKCALCHSNAGANQNTTGTNFNFNTGVEDLPDQPADLITDEVMNSDLAQNPPDNGFGMSNDPAVNPAVGTFNTPPLIEAADTGPFFHNNSIATIEAAVGFYDGDAFNESPAGEFLASTDSQGAGIELDGTQISAIAALLRVLNALENIRSATDSAEVALQTRRPKRALSLVESAIVEVEDAIQVLDGGDLHPEAQRLLRRALLFLQLAVKKHFGPMQKKLLNQALDKMEHARRDMVVS